MQHLFQIFWSFKDVTLGPDIFFPSELVLIMCASFHRLNKNCKISFTFWQQEKKSPPKILRHASLLISHIYYFFWFTIYNIWKLCCADVCISLQAILICRIQMWQPPPFPLCVISTKFSNLFTPLPSHHLTGSVISWLTPFPP